MRRNLLLISLFFAFLNSVFQVVYAEPDLPIPFCEKKKLKGENYTLCEEVLSGYDLRSNPKKYDIKTIQYVVRHVYDLYSAYWHEKDVIDKNRLEISLLFLDKFGRNFIVDTTDVGTYYYRQMFDLAMYTNEKTFDIYKEYLLRPSTTIDNLSEVLHFTYMNKFDSLNKNDFETLIYLLNDNSLPDKYLANQTKENIYSLLLLGLKRSNIDETQKKYSKMYFDNLLYKKLLNKKTLTKDNLEIFEYLTRVQYLKENKKDLLNKILSTNYDISSERFKKIMYCHPDEKISEDAINYVIRTDKIIEYADEISDLNSFALVRKEYDANYMLKNHEVKSIIDYPLDKTVKIQILNETLQNPYIIDKYNVTYRKISKIYQKQVDKKEMKECFTSFDAHMSNIFAPRTNKKAFAVGMLNPINLVGTVAASPIILLFWPLKTLK